MFHFISLIRVGNAGLNAKQFLVVRSGAGLSLKVVVITNAQNMKIARHQQTAIKRRVVEHALWFKVKVCSTEGIHPPSLVCSTKQLISDSVSF